MSSESLFEFVRFTSFVNDVKNAYADFEAKLTEEEELEMIRCAEKDHEEIMARTTNQQSSYKESFSYNANQSSLHYGKRRYGFIGRTSEGPLDLLPTPLLFVAEMLIAGYILTNPQCR